MKEVAPAARAWLWVSAGVTIGVICLAAILAPPVTAHPGMALTWLLFLGSSVHVSSTGYLLTVPEVRANLSRDRARYVVGPLALITTAVVAAVLLPPSGLDWALLLTFAWQFSHFQKQNLGMMALAASSHHLPGPGLAERRALSLAGLAGIVGLMAHPGLLQVKVTSPLTPLFPAAGTLFGLSVLTGIAALLSRPRHQRCPGFSVVSLTSFLFFAPVFMLRSPYAAVAGMTIAHGAQYLIMIGLVAAGRGGGAQRPLGVALLLNIALLGGLVLSTTSHLHGGPAPERVLFGLYLGVVMSHFVLDAGIWRLRDPTARRFISSHLPFLVPPGVRSARVLSASLSDTSGADI
jgi:hypothetical protein